MSQRLVSTILLLMAAALGAGCSSTGPSKFYTLNPTAQGGSGKATYSVCVGPVSVPEMLDRPQMVVQTGANQVWIDDYNRWASPLQSEIARTVAEDLVKMLGTPLVSVYRQPTGAGASYRVAIDVVRFESVPGKRAALDALWKVRGPKEDATRTGRTVTSEPLADDAYPTLVAAHSRALGRLSAEVADAIRALDAGGR